MPEQTALPEPIVTAPVFELNYKEIAFPQNVLGKTIYVHMRPYTAEEMKDLQYARALRMAQMDEFTDVKDVGKAEVIEFFWNHFIKLSGPGVKRKDGSEGTAEEHKAFIQQHPRLDIERITVLQGFGNLDVAYPEVDTSLLDLAEENKVTVTKNLFVPDLKRTYRYSMTHVFRQETEADKRKYEQASGNIRIWNRRRESQVLINYNDIEKLYNSLIIKIEGVTFNGQPCVRNADILPWIVAMPFWWKDIVLTELFRGASAKNE